MKILAISDVHADPEQPEAWEKYFARAQDEQPDVLVMAGDLAVGKSTVYETLLSQFDYFSGPKLFVPGNHDLWQLHSKRQTWRRYDEELPAAVSAGGWQYLDLGPVLLDDVAFVGCMGWYDYSLRQTQPPARDARFTPAHVTAPGRGLKVDPARAKLSWDEITPEDYQTRALQVGDENTMQGVIWNDAFYIDWQRSDAEMSQLFCEKLRAQAKQVARRAKRIVAITHFVPFAESLRDYAEVGPAYARAFAGSVELGKTILSLPKASVSIFGHWHSPGSWRIGDLRAYNVAAKGECEDGTLITL